MVRLPAVAGRFYPGDPKALSAAIDGFLEIGGFLDTGLKQQAQFNLDALERKIKRRLPEQERNELLEKQRRALRWTYLGSGLRHEKFRATIGAISPAQLLRIDSIAPSFS